MNSTPESEVKVTFEGRLSENVLVFEKLHRPPPPQSANSDATNALLRPFVTENVPLKSNPVAV